MRCLIRCDTDFYVVPVTPILEQLLRRNDDFCVVKIHNSLDTKYIISSGFVSSECILILPRRCFTKLILSAKFKESNELPSEDLNSLNELSYK